MNQSIQFVPPTHGKHEILDVNGLININEHHNWQNDDDICVRYWVCKCGTRLQTIKVENQYIINSKGNNFILL